MSRTYAVELGEYDTNAIRVEVMGQHVTYVAKTQAACLSPLVRRTCGGA